MSPKQSPPLFTYRQYPCVEAIAYYREGGFHPIHIDDILHNRYRIIDKLGYGSYGTIWLVDDIASGRFAALKVLAADFSKVSEVAIHRRLKQRQLNDGGSDGQEFLVEYLDDFKVEGPNGTHQCIVTEVLGPSLGADIEEIYGPEERYPIEIAKNVVAQIMRGVAYLHSCGVVHGDLHVGNILFRIPGIEQMSCQDLQKYLGEPRKRLLSRRDGKLVTSSPHEPKYVVSAPQRQALLELCLNSSDAVRVKICDFGEAFLWDGKPVITQLHTPSVYAAPEIIFHDHVSPGVDVWALAVLMHMVLSGGSLLFVSPDGIKKEVLREMVLTLGKLPDRWWTKWEDRSEYFDENGLFIGDRTHFPGVSGQFLKMPSERMETEELEGLEKLFRMMVSYGVTDRISAAEVVQLTPQSWMKGSHKELNMLQHRHCSHCSHLATSLVRTVCWKAQQPLQESTPNGDSQVTFATTPATVTLKNTATIDSAVLATSNGRGGSSQQLGSTSFVNSSGAVGVMHAPPGALAAGAVVVGRHVMR
ncbi:kinase-like domain-containing protein [Gautieria morchelliformis]|nr:kinase-like domain-containing protein [Gautieria morchelliformis]